jgi:hypothetical protein
VFPTSDLGEPALRGAARADTVVENDSPTNSDSPKILDATCPPGSLAISATSLTNFSVFASIAVLQVNPDRSGARLVAQEISPTGEAWDFEPRAICFQTA